MRVKKVERRVVSFVAKGVRIERWVRDFEV